MVKHHLELDRCFLFESDVTSSWGSLSVRGLRPKERSAWTASNAEACCTTVLLTYSSTLDAIQTASLLDN